VGAAFLNNWWGLELFQGIWFVKAFLLLISAKKEGFDNNNNNLKKNTFPEVSNL